MNIVFLMDPLEQVIFEKDTSLALMWGAQRKGHRIFYLPNDGITLDTDGPRFYVTEIEATRDKSRLFIKKTTQCCRGDQIDILFIRTDPPFESRYLLNTWLLDLLPESTAVINRPSGVRTVNEKLWALNFPDLIPPTLVTQQKDELLSFIQEHDRVIVKPTDSYGGQKIFMTGSDDVNKSVILETVSENFRKKIIIQRYIEDAENGDKRILLINGDPLGAILRVHAPGEHRNNIFAGGACYSTEITDYDRQIIHKLKPELLKLGLYFVGIDIIGDYLIEVNVTSPTCLQEMNRAASSNNFNGQTDLRLEDKVIEFAEQLAKERKK